LGEGEYERVVVVSDGLNVPCALCREADR